MNENNKIIIASVVQTVLNLVQNENNIRNLQMPQFEQNETDDEDFEYYMRHFVTKKSLKSQKQQQQQQEKNYDILNELESAEFEQHLHMSKTTYVQIFQLLQSALNSLECIDNLTLPQVYALSLWKLTTNTQLQPIAQAGENPEQKFCSVIAERFMPWPNSYETQQFTLQSFNTNIRARFPGLFGVVAIKHLTADLAAEEGQVPIVLQIICNGHKKIIDCCVELAADYNFSNTPIGQMLSISKKTLPQNTYLAGTHFCPLKKYLLRPFVGAKLHVNEHLFNLALGQPLSLAEEVVDELARRFYMLHALSAQNLTELRSIVETMCSLHNLCLETQDDYLQRNQDFYIPTWHAEVKTVPDEIHEADEEGRLARSNILNHIIKLN